MIFKQFFDKVSFTYTYLIADKKGSEACIIDPVFKNVNSYLKVVKNLKLSLLKVIDTHIHSDHITGVSALKEKTDCLIIMGKSENSPLIANIEVKDREIIKIGNLKMTALFTPGHTCDSYSFKLNDRVFTGDTLLISGSGRTDLPGGDPYKSYDSIFKVLLKLKDETLVYPAHDYNGKNFSTIKKEKLFNPRLQVKNKKEYVNIMNNLNLPTPKLMDVAIPINKLGGKKFLLNKKY
jgi:glyoxylase-like metal-dependent hydrolase (beta-lactamase superfamily II)